MESTIIRFAKLYSPGLIERVTQSGTKGISPEDIEKARELMAVTGCIKCEGLEALYHNATAQAEVTGNKSMFNKLLEFIYMDSLQDNLKNSIHQYELSHQPCVNQTVGGTYEDATK